MNQGMYKLNWPGTSIYRALLFHEWQCGQVDWVGAIDLLINICLVHFTYVALPDISFPTKDEPFMWGTAAVGCPTLVLSPKFVQFMSGIVLSLISLDTTNICPTLSTNIRSYFCCFPDWLLSLYINVCCVTFSSADVCRLCDKVIDWFMILRHFVLFQASIHSQCDSGPDDIVVLLLLAKFS